MISLVPNTTIFRRVPYQNGDHRLDLSMLLNNHNNDVTFSLSGAGSVFFKFGANSGNYFASGNDRTLFFQATTPNTQQDFSFVISQTSYDVYDADGNPLILGETKPTGTTERIYLNTTTDAAGEFQIDLYGNRPNLSVFSGAVLPTTQNFITGLLVQNLTSIPFHILSGNFSSNSISGVESLPIFFDASSSQVLPISGRLPSLGSNYIQLTLNSDFADFDNIINFTGTSISGSGYTITTPDAETIAYKQSSDTAFIINNNGTEIVKFQPKITQITRDIPIGGTSYSGVQIPNYFSGYFDTSDTFYFSDNIVFSGGAFNIIQESATGISILNITGEDLTTGLFIGSEESVSAGQSFTFPFDFNITGYTLKMCATGSGFAGTEYLFTNILNGNGVTGAVLSTSNNILCSTIPTGIFSGSGVYFSLPVPLQLYSGQTYSIVLGGDNSWVGNPAPVLNKKIVLLQNAGDIYTEGSGFKYDGTTTTFTGDALLNISWNPPTGANRYFVNVISGDRNQPYYLTTGAYRKYMAHKSFVFADQEITSLPNEIKFFTMTYTGAVSGTNIAQLQLLGTNYLQNISGVTT